MKIPDDNFEYYEVGDIVILTKSSRDTKTLGFSIGKLYHVTIVDDEGDDDFPYEIGEISDNFGVFVMEDQIRFPTQKDIDKYKEKYPADFNRYMNVIKAL